MPTAQGSRSPGSLRFSGNNGSHDAPPIGVFFVLALSFVALSIGGVWAVMLYGAPSKPLCSAQLSFSRLGRGDVLVLLQIILALLRSTLGRFLGRPVVLTYQRSSLNSRSCRLRIDYLIEMNEIRNGEQKEQKYLYFEMFYGGQKLYKYFRSLLIKDTSLMTC